MWEEGHWATQAFPGVAFPAERTGPTTTVIRKKPRMQAGERPCHNSIPQNVHPIVQKFTVRMKMMIWTPGIYVSQLNKNGKGLLAKAVFYKDLYQALMFIQYTQSS